MNELLIKALEQIARFTKDGEPTEDSEMSIDDAFDTARAAIDIARAALVAAKDTDR